MRVWLGRLGLVAIFAALYVTPTPADSPPAGESAEVEAIQKQMAELQKKLDALKLAKTPAATSPDGMLPESVSSHFSWRNVGPANMGGRVTALALVEKEPTTYYVATGAGGLLKTTNNGTTFDILFDKQSTVAIGDVAVCQADPNIVWVGTGEANPRNSVSYGDGVYKSVDAGKTWARMGLEKTFQIGKILIHPKNPEIVYVGALGRLYGPSEDRGLYKTTDGGKTWAKVLYVDDKTGVIDAALDPADPETIVAAMWERKRDEFDGFFGDAPVPDTYGPIVTHGAGGGLHKSTDGGKTWKRVSDAAAKSGLPTVKTGRIGLDVSRKTKGLIIAIIDAEKVGTGELSKVYLGVVGEGRARERRGETLGRDRGRAGREGGLEGWRCCHQNRRREGREVRRPHRLLPQQKARRRAQASCEARREGRNPYRDARPARAGQEGRAEEGRPQEGRAPLGRRDLRPQRRRPHHHRRDQGRPGREGGPEGRRHYCERGRQEGRGRERLPRAARRQEGRRVGRTRRQARHRGDDLQAHPRRRAQQPVQPHDEPRPAVAAAAGVRPPSWRRGR